MKPASSEEGTGSPQNDKALATEQLHSLFAHPGHERDILRAWEDFLSGESSVGAPVRVVVESSWKRSSQRGVDAHGKCTPIVLGGDPFQTVLKRNRVLSSAAEQTMRENAELLRGTRSILILTDPTGIILNITGDPGTMDRGQDINLTFGGSWNEADIGTNAIGTAIAIGNAVQVHASEHFCEGVKKWTCAAAPIRDPRDKSLLGVLDISGPNMTFCQHNLALALTAAHHIEATILERLLAERARLLEACLNAQPHGDEGMVLLDSGGRIVCVNGEAAEQIDRGEISASMRVGKQLTDSDDPWDLEELQRSLPQDLNPEWLHPVTARNKTLGALIVIPKHAARHYLPSTQPSRQADDAATQSHPPGSAQAHTENAPIPSRGGHRSTVSSSHVVPAENRFLRIIGSSPAIKDTIARARKLAQSPAPLLIEGETGVGKELFSAAIQAAGSRHEGPYVSCNCGAVPEDLIGSELFGYVKGAFTGASSEGRVGRFELADGGTLCLDEIGEMPLNLQPYLLRVLDEGIVYRLGENKARRVAVRLITMTNRNLQEEVMAGRFRRDLFFRISVTTLTIPPLRERGDDVDELIAHFLSTLSEHHGLEAPVLDAEVRATLRAYEWPGNVRELRNLVESLVLTAGRTPVGLADLPAQYTERKRKDMPARETGVRDLDTTERQAIENAIQINRGNLSRTARALGISRSTLYRKIDHFQLAARLGMAKTKPSEPDR